MPLSITPIYDRTQSDITNKTSKAYLNFSDWDRIWSNSEELNNLLVSKLGSGITLNTAPDGLSTSTVMTITILNALIKNIDDIRAHLAALDSSIPDIPGIVELKYDWIAGPHQQAPTYRNVNDWERVTALLYARVSAYVIARAGRTGIAAVGRSLTRNNKFRS